MMLIIFIIMTYLSGMYMYSCNRKHLLLMLLSLEFIVLSLYMMMMFYLSMSDYEYYFGLFFLVFSVCEGVVGLSLLISMIRTHGNDFFQTLSIF